VHCFNQLLEETYEGCSKCMIGPGLRDKGVISDVLLRSVRNVSQNNSLNLTDRLIFFLYVT
jgi:hypothetical protein